MNALRYIFISLFVLLISCNKEQVAPIMMGSVPDGNSYKRTIEDTEINDPLGFLWLTECPYGRTISGDVKELEGRVTNNATVATFKYVAIHVKFFNKNKEEILSRNHHIYDVFQANSTTPFRIKTEIPKGAVSADWEIKTGK